MGVVQQARTVVGGEGVAGPGNTTRATSTQELGDHTPVRTQSEGARRTDCTQGRGPGKVPEPTGRTRNLEVQELLVGTCTTPKASSWAVREKPAAVTAVRARRAR